MRAEFGPWKFKQEFECAFVEAVDQYFADDMIERAFARSPAVLQLEF